MGKQGKKHLEALNTVDRTKTYTPQEAISLAKQVAHVGFDETVEVHMRMGVDPRHADQQVRGVALLPNGLGKAVRVLVFTQGESEKAARDAGADNVGGDELIKKIEDGWLEFDVAIATPDMMSKIGKLGKILGRRGLMPNPKSGTVSQPADLPRVIADARNTPLGKISFDDEKLLENLATLVDAVVKARPSGAKGQFIKSISLTTSMGPGIRLDLAPTLSLTTV